MQINEFIEELTKWIKKYDGLEDITVGKDKTINTRIVIDDKGVIWIREGYTWNRVKTSVNVENVIEFRASDDRFVCFFVICEDNTGFAFESDGEIYYYVDGEPSGWGSAFEHFSKFPVTG